MFMPNHRTSFITSRAMAEKDYSYAQPQRHRDGPIGLNSLTMGHPVGHPKLHNYGRRILARMQGTAYAQGSPWPGGVGPRGDAIGCVLRRAVHFCRQTTGTNDIPHTDLAPSSSSIAGILRMEGRWHCSDVQVVVAAKLSTLN